MAGYEELASKSRDSINETESQIIENGKKTLLYSHDRNHFGYFG